MNHTQFIKLTHPFKTLPNQVTLVRFLVIPILWVFALMRLPFYVGIGLILALGSDALDGHLARRLNMVSEFGGKFDSLTDLLLTLSVVIWILMLRPEIFAENPVLSVIAIVIYIIALLVSWIKFGPMAYLDLYLSKMAALTEYVFIIHTFLFDHYNRILFSIAIGMAILSCTETLVLRLIQSQADEPVGSILLTFRRKRRAPRS
jgi:phosphatidylglycerophosphate synthase